MKRAVRQGKQHDEEPERTGAQKLLWNFRYTVLPFQPFDNFDMSLRTAMAVTAVVAVLLYADTEWVATNLPTLFVGLIIMYSLSIIPVLSGQISMGISHFCGIWFAVVLAYLVILMLTPDTEMEEYENVSAGVAALSRLDIPCNCSSICATILTALSASTTPGTAPPPSFVFEGEVGDVSEVALG